MWTASASKQHPFPRKPSRSQPHPERGGTVKRTTPFSHETFGPISAIAVQVSAMAVLAACTLLLVIVPDCAENLYLQKADSIRLFTVSAYSKWEAIAGFFLQFIFV